MTSPKLPCYTLPYATGAHPNPPYFVWSLICSAQLYSHLVVSLDVFICCRIVALHKKEVVVMNYLIDLRVR